MASAAGGGKDFYKILNVSRTASSSEIKHAYRKLALALHPDRHDGCDQKSDEFKDLNEAYKVLSDNAQRTSYDRGSSQKQKRRPPPPNYRKVYSPRAPPGFKTFNAQKHFDMHYGDGMMKEEVSRARKRAQQASGRQSGYDYTSPLGKGFTFTSKDDHNPYARKTTPQGPPPEMKIDYEDAHYYDMDGSALGKAKRVVRARESVRTRMDERRKNRMERRKQGGPKVEEGCCVM